MERLLARGAEFTALFPINDLMANGAINALQRHGRRVPDDVSIVGFDDILMAAAVFPPLTTVAQPIREMGRQSVRLLLNRIAQRDAPASRVTMPTTFVERESCRAVAPGKRG
jgi:DNA-binding LacI/PurR family transcriptional regulator